MKHIIFTISLLALLCGCSEKKWILATSDKKFIHDTEDSNNSYIVTDITVEGETHQYLIRYDMYRGGLCHLPNCKYCASKKKGLNP